MSTTMAAVRLLTKLLRHEDIGKRIVPIIPDEARTFGMDSLFRQIGIYSPKGQLYEPVDRETLLYYNEAKDGQILEEGITEAGSMSSFIAAGTAYANLGDQHDSLLLLLFDVRLSAHRRSHLGWQATIRPKDFCSARRRAAPPSMAKGCNIKTATVSCLRARFRPC